MPDRGQATPATPRNIKSVDECDFYHTIDLPGGKTIAGHWDLRSSTNEYLGGQEFEGRTVLDVGPASGFLTFEMEKRGAAVTAFDFDDKLVGREHDIIPYADFEERFGQTRSEFQRELLAGLDQMKNSFWYCHRLLESNARVFYGDVYNPPNFAGSEGFDYVVFGNILTHLQNPLRALANFASLATDKTIITETTGTGQGLENEAIAMLRPGAKDDPVNFGTWWQYTPEFFKQFLTVLGYKDFEVRYHEQHWVQGNQYVNHYTVIASR